MTDGEIEEANAGINNADGELNLEYRRVLGLFNPSGASSLRVMQRAWVDFKSKDFALFSEIANESGAHERRFRYLELELANQTDALGALSGPGVRRAGERPGPDGEAKDAVDADRLLNEQYIICTGLLREPRLKRFKEIQAGWIQFRDYYCRLVAALKGDEAAGASLEVLTMRRVVQFRFYVQIQIRRELPLEPGVADLYQQRAKDSVTEGAEDPAVPDIFRFAR